MLQRTNFNIEILIHDDCSIDNTGNIIREYQKKYPNLINAIFQSENQHSKGIDVFSINYNRAQGKYIALCEGDDYWTDPHKLQKQVDFLDENIDFSTSFHWANLYDQELNKQVTSKYGPAISKPVYTTEDLLRSGNFIPTCTVVFRNSPPNALPKWFYEVPVGDFPLHFINASRGKIGFIAETMATYRKHKNATHSALPRIQQFKKTLKTYFVIGDNLGFLKKTSYRLGILKLNIMLLDALLIQNKKGEAFIISCRALRVAPGKQKIVAIYRMLHILFSLKMFLPIKKLIDFLALTRKYIKT